MAYPASTRLIEYVAVVKPDSRFFKSTGKGDGAHFNLPFHLPHLFELPLNIITSSSTIHPMCTYSSLVA
jgi:hypothetical protein